MSELEELISLLHPKTMDGKLKWTINGDDRIYTIQGGNTVEIESYTDNVMLKAIRVRNQDGVILLSEFFNRSDESFEKLQSIIDKARRLALKVDETLHDLKERINSL